MRVEDDRWRVRFTGAPGQDEEDVRALALRRAAELALAAGFEGFRVVSEDVERIGDRESPVGVRGGVAVGAGSGGWRGSGVGIGLDIDPSRQRRFSVRLEIIAGAGPQAPGGGDNAYNARAILDAAERRGPAGRS